MRVAPPGNSPADRHLGRPKDHQKCGRQVKTGFPKLPHLSPRAFARFGKRRPPIGRRWCAKWRTRWRFGGMVPAFHDLTPTCCLTGQWAIRISARDAYTAHSIYPNLFEFPVVLFRFPAERVGPPLAAMCIWAAYLAGAGYRNGEKAPGSRRLFRPAPLRCATLRNA